MKRGFCGGEVFMDEKMKKVKVDDETEQGKLKVEEEQVAGFSSLDDNLIFEVMKHVDARTLGMASSVSKQWHKTGQDERLWELICTRHWNNIGCGNQQLRSVVLALGGFRRLHSLYIWPLTKPPPRPQSTSASASSSSSPSSSLPSCSSSASSSSPWAVAAPLKPMVGGAKPNARWGKDEVNLSLSLLSIRFYEKMNYSNRSGGGAGAGAGAGGR